MSRGRLGSKACSSINSVKCVYPGLPAQQCCTRSAQHRRAELRTGRCGRRVQQNPAGRPPAAPHGPAAAPLPPGHASSRTGTAASKKIGESGEMQLHERSLTEPAAQLKRRAGAKLSGTEAGSTWPWLHPVRRQGRRKLPRNRNWPSRRKEAAAQTTKQPLEAGSFLLSRWVALTAEQDTRFAEAGDSGAIPELGPGSWQAGEQRPAIPRGVAVPTSAYGLGGHPPAPPTQVGPARLLGPGEASGPRCPRGGRCLRHGSHEAPGTRRQSAARYAPERQWRHKLHFSSAAPHCCLQKA